MKTTFTQALCLALLGATAMASTAQAQTTTDVVVMRRQITAPNPTIRGSWTPGATTSDAPACSATAPATTAMSCRDEGGREVSATACPTPKPSGVTTIADYSTCTYQPVVGEWTEWTRQCGPATRTKTNTCLRQPLAQQVDPLTYCSLPAVQTENETMVAGCGTWRASYGSCVAGKQSPLVECVDSTGKPVSEGMCSAATKPTPAVETCQYSEDFEKTPTGFGYPYMVTTSPSAHSGSYVMPMSTTGRNDTLVTASTTLEVGRTYYFTVWVRNAGTTGNNTLLMLLYDSKRYIVDKTFPVSANWEKHTIPFVAENKTAIIRLIQGGGDPGIQVDDVSVTPR